MISPTKPGPKLLVVVRHGESLRNALKRGRLDYPDTPEARELARLQDYEIPLSPLGRGQAAALGPVLRARFGHFDRCYDSGYRRAVETRELALAAGYSSEELTRLALRSDMLLREREPGLMRTMTSSEMEQSPLLRRWLAEYEANPFQTRHLGGESVADVCDRVRQFLLLVIEHHSDERLLVFCHNLVIKAIRIGRVIRYVGFLLEGSRSIHCLRHRGVLEDDLRDPTYARRMVCAYRLLQ